ncbi:MAG: S8 family serine peptidase, partial [Candidatus Binatia bacterium]
AFAADRKSSIEWEGPFKNEYRISPDVYGAKQKNGAISLASDKFEIQLYKDPTTNADTLGLIDSIKTSPVRGQQEISHYVNLVAGLDEAGIKALSARPDVISIHRFSQPAKLDERQDIILTGNLTGNAPTPGDYMAYLTGKGFSQSQFDASNFLVDISDSPVDNGTTSPNHFAFHVAGNPALPSRVIYSRLEGVPNNPSSIQGCDGHGTLNASIIMGNVPGGAPFNAFPHADASQFRYGLGVAPFVRLGSSIIFDPDDFTFPIYANLQSEAFNGGARISSNSWGEDDNSYNIDSQSYDFLVRDAQPDGSTFANAGNQQMVIVFSAGNGGSGFATVGSPGTAKNVITVGASEGVQAFGGQDQCAVTDSQADNAFDIIPFSSRGPTFDQRKKPDIMLPGSHISGVVGQQNSTVGSVTGNGLALTCFSSDATGVCGGAQNSNFWPLNQQWYTASSGTSHSTPAVAGLAALIRQDFINRTLTPPSPAMTKGIIMNSAAYMNGAGANDSLPSNNQGMGLANMNNYLDIFAQPNIIRDQLAADLFTASGQSRVFTGTIVSGAKPFRVTLAWTDAPGTTTAHAFVNNLDLEVTVGGQTYLGNVFNGANSAPGGNPDARNNVESVFLPAG